MKICLSFIFCLICEIASASGYPDEYAVSNIPQVLLKNVNVVKRTEQIVFEITEGNRAKYRRKVAYTILNENGDRWGYFGEGYDKLRSIESFEGTLYDANGKKIKSLKKADIKDVTGNDGGSLADDHRVKWHSFFYKNYPYTIEYEIALKYQGTMFVPDWIPQEKETMSVQEGHLTVISPAVNPLRYKMFNYKGQPVITESKSDKIYNWEVKDIAGVKNEYVSPDWREVTVSVFLATERFVLEDYQGSNTTWNDFGKFVYDLKKERDVLPDDIKLKVHQLTDGLPDVKEKISKLYEFMQQNTRYVGVQLGIGGWQPFDAKYVAAKKYGDCKALSNFMYSLLKEAGIRSVYTVTTRGFDQDYLLTDLPSSQFNHVVLFVPLGKDTTWLECTSQTLIPGYVGRDNCNRYALAIDENGGTLVRTPWYGLKENIQVRKIKAVLNEESLLQVKVVTTYGGIQQDEIHHLINSLSKEKVKEVLHEDLDFATYDISNFNYSQNRSALPQIEEELEIVVSNYASITGKRLFIVPNIMTRTHRKLSADEERKFDIDLTVEYKDVDTAEIILPPGYSLEAMPKDVSVTTKFGKYDCNVKLNGNKLFYHRTMEHYSGRFPASDYPELVKFYETIYKADRGKVVLVKNETGATQSF